MDHLKIYQKLIFSGIGISCLTSIGAWLWLGHSTHPIHSNPSKEQARANFFKLPLFFESNQGQATEDIRYLAHGLNYGIYFTAQKIIIGSHKNQISINFVGANEQPKIIGQEKRRGISNYFIGERKNWKTNIAHFAKVEYQNLYQGIDAVFYGNQGKLEYDLKVAPGADPKQIKLNISQAKLNLDDQGNLILSFADNQKLFMNKPVVYQMLDQERKIIPANFVLLANNQVSFALGSYDKTKELIIDPTFLYSSYLGGSGIEGSATDAANCVAVDNDGYAYIGGQTNSTDFPTKNPEQSGGYGGGGSDGFVAKFDPFSAGDDSLVYSTYLGGPGTDIVYGIAVDTSGSAYVTGETSPVSPDTDPFFPTTTNAEQPNYGGGDGDVFLSRLSPAGDALYYSSYLGGNGLDAGYGIALDSTGNAYLTGVTFSINYAGVTDDFPVTLNALQFNYGGGYADAFFAKLTAPQAPTIPQKIYATYLGSEGQDVGKGIAVDDQGYAYLTGFTSSSTNNPASKFPATPGAFQTALAGPNDAFATKISADGNPLAYSTYLGGTDNDYGTSIVVDSNHQAYITGGTTGTGESSTNYPKTANSYPAAPYDVLGSQYTAAIVTELNATGSALIYSGFITAVNGQQAYYTFGNSITLDDLGNIYLVGQTDSDQYPLVNYLQAQANIPAQNENQGGFGVETTTISAINPKLNGNAGLVFSSYVGGNGKDTAYGVAAKRAKDKILHIYVAGITESPRISKNPPVPFPTTVNDPNVPSLLAYQDHKNPTDPANNGTNGFLYVLQFTAPPAVSLLVDPYSCQQPARLKLSQLRSLRAAITLAPPQEISAIDPASLSLNGSPVLTDCAGKPSCLIENLANGEVALVCKFGVHGTALAEVVGTGARCGHTGRLADLTITGSLNQEAFVSSSAVCVLPSSSCKG